MSNSVTIENFESTYLLPRGHPAPEQLRGQLDDLMRHRLSSACSYFLEQTLDPNDPSFWLIRSLDVDLSLDVGSGDEVKLARLWGQQISACLSRSIERGEDGQSVLFFPSRAAYLAQFIADLARDRAWDKWYYRAFDSLRSLPRGTAMREALLREPTLADAALLYLTETGRLGYLLDEASESDARRLYENCTAHIPAGPIQRDLLDMLLSIWKNSTPRRMGAHMALQLYFEARRSLPGASPASVHAAVKCLLDFSELMRAFNSQDMFIARLKAGDLSGAFQLLRHEGLERHVLNLHLLRQLATDDDAWLADLASSVAPTNNVNAGAILYGDASGLRTSFGGVFLLLPAWLDVCPFVSSDEPDERQRQKLLTYLVLLKCLGRERVLEAHDDPALLLVAGLDEPPSAESLLELSAHASLLRQRAMTLSLLSRLRERGRIDGRVLVVDLIALESDERALLLRDVVHDEWVAAVHLTSEKEANTSALIEGLRLVAEAAEAAAETLLLAREVAERVELDELARVGWRLSWLDEKQDSDDVTARYRARAASASTECSYFSLDQLIPGWTFGAGVNLNWSLLAHAVMRAFAQKLLGFDWSSAEFLYRNFLAGLDTLHVRGTQLDVELAQRPLQLILQMAGAHGRTLALPWLEGREINLSFAGE